jgi:hypothetical protein
VLENVEAMSSRVCIGPPIENRVVGREVRDLCARLEVMEEIQRRTYATRDLSDAESEEIEFEEAIGEAAGNKRFLKVVMKLGAREKIDVPMYEGNLDVEELLD